MFPLPIFAQVVGPNPQNAEYILPSPNPFRDYCQIALSGSAPADIFDMELRDIPGRIILSSGGTVEELNLQLRHIKPLQSGWYILKIRDKNNGTTYTRKITRL
jgi:hypothetical protein